MADDAPTLRTLIDTYRAAHAAVEAGSRATHRPYGGDPALWDALVDAEAALHARLKEIPGRTVRDGRDVFWADASGQLWRLAEVPSVEEVDG